MNREKQQLSFAVRYYFQLCEKLLRKFDANDIYWEENVRAVNNSKRLYQVHLASCCLRLSPLIEMNGITHKMAYGYLENVSTKNQNIQKYMPFLIRDTVSHSEAPGHPMFDARKLELENIKINEVHTIIKTSITIFCT